jgi:palmitoyl-protein thioesterase
MWFLVVALPLVVASPTPVVLWHGMGDDCCNPESMGMIEKLVENATGAFVYSVRIGKNNFDDRLNGFFKPPAEQVAEACAALSAVPQLSGGFHAVGFSQGGQFLRAVIQQCAALPPVLNLVSVGGQHQGVFGLPDCLAARSWMCVEARRLIDDIGPYDPFVQAHSTQAGYWHDADNEAEYVRRNHWLPPLNGAPFDPAQRARLSALRRFVMVRFENDTMVQPRESSHFGWYKNGSDTVSVPLQQTPLYTDPADVLGLRAMDAAGKLVFIDTPGEHLQFTRAWFLKAIVQPYLM